jgi:ribosome maturation factor RimP
VGDRQVTARVTATDETGVTLDVAGTADHVPYAGLGPGRVQVEFKRLAELDDDDEDLIEDEEGEDEE